MANRQPESGEFERFMVEVQPRLLRALTAALGFERGREATAEALAWAWEHWSRMQTIERKVPYLFRVGQSRTRTRKQPLPFERVLTPDEWFEPGLGGALASLSERQRTAVVLVHGYSWTLSEVAELTGTRISTVQTHLERGLRSLRQALEVGEHV